MPYGSDGSNTRSREVRQRIDWGARRRAVSALLRNPPSTDFWGVDTRDLIEVLNDALYQAESQAERVPHPELLRAVLIAKDAAYEMWRRFGRPIEED